MVVNLIRKNHLYFITLPSKVKGQFWLCDKDEHNRSMSLYALRPKITTGY